jgi:hypothetical protein
LGYGFEPAGILPEAWIVLANPRGLPPTAACSRPRGPLGEVVAAGGFLAPAELSG